MLYSNPYPNLFGNYITRKFSDVFPTEEEFVSEFAACPFAAVTNQNDLPVNAIPDKYIKLTYWLLMTRYANSTVASADETQFKYKVFSLMFTHGPTWIKRLEIQNDIRNMSEEELRMGSKIINNNAYNPGTEPSTATLEELTAINAQNTSNRKKSKLEAYTSLLALMDVDVTEDFISRFKPLFLKVVQPNLPLWYITEEGDPTYDIDNSTL